MPSEQEFQNLVRAADQQKGELLYLQTLFISFMRAMPPELQSSVYQHFLKAAESARRTALFSQASEGVISSFEHYVSSLQTPTRKAP